MAGLNITGDENGNALPPTIKLPIGTNTITNPLNAYASYTYAWSLWWLNVEDFNRLMSSDDVDSALAWQPSLNSYVVAEDSGLYPTRRVPGILPVNYNIQDVEFTTVIAPNKQSRSSNMIDGKLTIIEPYGVTFIDSLIAASYDGQKYNNYTSQPYMLQLEFFGYDDNGDPIPKNETEKFVKRFPIKLLGVKVEVSGSQGSTYEIDFCPTGHVGHSPEKASLPKDFTVTAGKVGEFFYQLEALMNGFYQIDAYTKGNASYADSIHFDIDSSIAGSAIVYSKGVPLGDTNPASTEIDTSKSNFNIKAGTTLLSIIDRVMAQSQYLISQLKDAGSSDPKIQQNIFNAYKTMVSIKHEGLAQGGATPISGVWDKIRNTLPVAITYKIGPYPTWKCESPHIPTLSDSRPFTIKEYNYLYTGKNTDVIDFKLNFDTTYYTAVLGYTSAVAATQSTGDTGTDSTNLFGKNFGLNPAVLLNNVPNVSPLRYRYIVGDQNLTVGGGLINNPKAQLAADAIKSIYSSLNGDMVTLDLNIIGDPTLIKQDDWLYVPSPTIIGSSYNNWDGQSQSSFAQQYGHIRMNAGDVVVKVVVNSPIDRDTDLTNEGLMYPQLGVNNQYTSLFSGQYKILTIQNKFASGKFTQTLELVRYLNQDGIATIAGAGETDRGTTASQQSQNNQSQSTPTNSTTVDPAAAYGGSDNTREQSGT